MHFTPQCRSRSSIAILSFLAVTVFAAPARSADKKPAVKHFLWAVKSKTATVYMLGSVHVAKKDLYPLHDAIETAFKKSETLVLEVSLDRQTEIEAGTKLLAIGRYGAGKSLEKVLPEKVKKKLDAHLTKRKTPVGAYNTFKPWMVSVVLTMQELQRHGFQPQHGIDRHFFKRAQGRKKIVGLETVDDQVNLFKGLSEKSQVKMLEQTLDEIGELDAIMSKTFKAWKTGDADQLDELMLKPMRKPEHKGLYKALFTDRNVKMAKKIEEFLKTKKTYFVVVGSGHLVGKEGIVELLRKKKLKVNQL